MTLSIFYKLNEGKIALWLVSPEGEIFYVNTPSSRYDDSITLPLSAGLWSIITVNESETGAFNGTKKIEAKIAYTENLAVQVDIKELKPNDLGVVVNGNSNELKIDLPQIAPDGHVSYGPYDLKAGDIVSSDITWSNDAGLYFSIGKEFMHFKGFYSTYNKFGEYMKKDIKVNEDGLYYIFIGNPSTDEPEVRDVSGTVKIYRKLNNAVSTNKNNTIYVDIPKTNGKIYIKNYGKYELNNDDTVVADLDWRGEGHVMFLYTKEKFDTESIAQLVEKGILPLGSAAKTFNNDYSNIPSISSNFTYVNNNKELKLSFTTTPNKPIYWSNQTPETGSYYIYVIATGDTGITDIKGEITFPISTNKMIDNSTIKKDLSTYGFPSNLTKDQLPNNLKSWIEECDKKQDLYLISKNDIWYVYCNLVTGNYALEFDNVTEPGSIILNISDIEGVGKGDGYALLSIPNYDSIQVFYKDKKVQFTSDNSNPISTGKSGQLSNGLDYFDKDSVVLEYYNRDSCTADNYRQNINGYKAELKFLNFSGSKVIYEFDYPKATTVDFNISADVDGAYKIAFVTENNKIITKASSYNGLSASKPIEFPKGKTKIVLIGEKATGNCNISISSEEEKVAIGLK